MTKREFFREIKIKTKHLTKSERREILSYYNEMISERMEHGMTEAQAIAALGSVDELMCSLPPAKPETVRRSPRLRAWHIVLIVLGSPVWIVLLAAFLVLVLAFYIVIWALVVACYAVLVALFASALVCLGAAFVSLPVAGPAYFFAYLGAAFVLGGLALLWLLPCNLLAKAMAKLSGKVGKGVFRLFFRR